MKVLADFNGLFRTEQGFLLCLSHTDIARTEKGTDITLSEGMLVTAYGPDTDDQGNPDELIASGEVICSPEWLKCAGSKWSLAIDDKGWRHASDIDRQK